MSRLIRLRPEPIPSIYPIPEYLADAPLKAKYEDMKAVFQVPWMGVVTMAYAHYPTFYDQLWSGLRPVCQSDAFSQALETLRQLVEAEVVKLSPPKITPRLKALGYAETEMDSIRQMVEVFSHGNFRYLMLASMVRLLLEGDDLPAMDVLAQPRKVPSAVLKQDVPFVLMEAHHADEPTQQVYADIKATLGLPFVNTDYRAFARWPSYFSLAWKDLKPSVGSTFHDSITQTIHDSALTLLETLPRSEAISPGLLRQAAQADAPLDEVIQMSRLFQWLLPGLVTNVAFFRHQLLD